MGKRSLKESEASTATKSSANEEVDVKSRRKSKPNLTAAVSGAAKKDAKGTEMVSSESKTKSSTGPNKTQDSKTPMKKPKMVNYSKKPSEEQGKAKDSKVPTEKQEKTKNSKISSENRQNSKTPMIKQEVKESKSPVVKKPETVEGSKIPMKKQNKFKRNRKKSPMKKEPQTIDPAAAKEKQEKSKRIRKNKKGAKKWLAVARYVKEHFDINTDKNQNKKVLKVVNKSLSAKVMTLLKTYKTIHTDKGMPKGLKCGVHNVSKSIQNKETKLVVIAGDNEPIDVIRVFPEMCSQKGVPCLVAGDREQLGTMVGLKRCAVIAVTEATEKELKPILKDIK